MGTRRKSLVTPQAEKTSYSFKPQHFEDEWSSPVNVLLEETIKPPKPHFHGLSQELAASFTTSFIQPKLVIGNPSDRYEQEADRVASDVVQKIHSPQLTNQSKTIQRKEFRENVSYDIESDLESSIQQTRGRGQSLDATLQATMGQAMGVDFSGVKIHTDSQSDHLNQSIQSKAFTTGRDIFFRQGAYNPSSRDGHELIAHELTHVVQQNHPIGSSQTSTNGLGKMTVQRKTEMDEEDWSPESAAYYMMNKQDGLRGQNKANASVWYNTLFSSGLTEDDPKYNEDQERVLKEQQAMLKRHFLAQAVFGVQGGTQFKKGKKRIGRNDIPDVAENYRPIEEFQSDEVSANLATLASGGGRFNYRSETGIGDLFNNFLMLGEMRSDESLDNRRDITGGGHGGQMPTSYMGAYQRVGTHGEDFSTGHIQEVDKTTGGIDSTGFDIPIGGIGLKLHDTKGRDVTTGYQGVSEAARRGRHRGSNTKKYQTGHGFHRHATDGMQSLTQIAFEGSAPHTDNIHGGSHGVAATVGKKVFGGASESTLTGQDKRSTLGLPSKIGGIKADVTEAGLGTLEKAYGLLKRLENSPYPHLKGMEKKFYQKLLTSTTAEERNEIIDDILGLEERIIQSEIQTNRNDEVDSSLLPHKLLGLSPESRIIEDLFNHPMIEKFRQAQGEQELVQDDNDDWQT
ncbi:eCIS core domain-containing protein [Pseudanabaena minima]|uniref:eCIS core domain-containing protein n=1 Tax=Pseudanabaena minima TaxID=890415 RepID=UPI003DA9EFEC